LYYVKPELLRYFASEWRSMVMLGPQQDQMIARCHGDTPLARCHGRHTLGAKRTPATAAPRPVRRLRHNARQPQDAVEMRDSRLSRDVVSSSPALSTTQRMKTSSLVLRTCMQHRGYFPVRACCVMVEIVLVCDGRQLPKRELARSNQERAFCAGAARQWSRIAAATGLSGGYVLRPTSPLRWRARRPRPARRRRRRPPSRGALRSR
jgi:hypothetical protein